MSHAPPLPTVPPLNLEGDSSLRDVVAAKPPPPLPPPPPSELEASGGWAPSPSGEAPSPSGGSVQESSEGDDLVPYWVFALPVWRANVKSVINHIFRKSCMKKINIDAVNCKFHDGNKSIFHFLKKYGRMQILQ